MPTLFLEVFVEAFVSAQTKKDIQQQIRRVCRRLVRLFISVLRDCFFLVLPTLTWRECQNNLRIAFGRQKSWVNSDIWFGLEQFFPLICNRPNSEVKRFFIAKNVERIKVVARGNLENE